ncbi:MAG: peptide deformylase [Sulfurovaceae bacterium]|nr:peptide deformylase [Sulfurovaceae bacterium]
MIKELLIYPDERILTPCTDVRIFDSKLWDVIENMKDTMEANNLDALSAIQIAIPYNIIIIKHHGIYNVYINPRIIRADGSMQNIESTSYYPNIEQAIPRHSTISIVYEDIHGNTHTALIDEPWLSGTIQRKIDYLFGGTFLAKLPKLQRDKLISALANNGLVAVEEVCPLFSPKDYFVSFTDKVLFFMLIALGITVIKYSDLKLWIDLGFGSVVLLMIGFFFYAQYEAKKYKQCTSCQIGNNIGVIAKRIGLGFIIFAVSRFF